MGSKETCRILVTQGGPYVVYGDVPLKRSEPVLNEADEPVEWSTTEPYGQESKYALCRCGRSQNKPYCDGSHKSSPWDSQLTADRSPRASKEIVFEKGDFVMTDDRPLCAGYAFCDLYGSVWDEMEHADDPEVRVRIAKQVMNCPSGRLAARPKGQSQDLESSTEPEIMTVPNGALRVVGEVKLETEDGFVFEHQNRRTLCRCGLSKNKPFCDGTHWESDFRAP